MKNTHFKKSYGLQDYLDYHSGIMSEAEMHNLEKAALTDPFLSEALDGFKNQKNIEIELKHLRDRLEKRVSKKTTPLLNSNIKLLFSSLTVAASLLIIIVGAYFVLNKNDKENKISPVIAQNSPAPINENHTQTASDLPAEKKEVTPIDKVSSKNLDESISITEAPVLLNSKLNTREIEIDFDGKKETVFEPPKIIEDLTIQTPVVTGNLMQKEKYTMSTAPIANEQPEELVTTKAIKKKNIVDQIDETKVASSSTMLSLNETSSTAYSTFFNSEPLSGWENFHQFIRENKKSIRDNEGKIISGKVTLSFFINKKGSPSKIKVEQSLNKDCDKEAIRLLNQGGNWKKVNNKRVNLEILF